MVEDDLGLSSRVLGLLACAWQCTWLPLFFFTSDLLRTMKLYRSEPGYRFISSSIYKNSRSQQVTTEICRHIQVLNPNCTVCTGCSLSTRVQGNSLEHAVCAVDGSNSLFLNTQGKEGQKHLSVAWDGYC